MIEQPTPGEISNEREKIPLNLSTLTNVNDIKKLESDLLLERQKSVEHEQTSLTDTLTGLPNRAALFQEAQKMIDEYNRHALDKKYAHQINTTGNNLDEYAVLFLDIDHFKIVNDTYGHDAGDDVLRVASKVLKEKFPRKTDIIARYGGEEFIVILKETHIQEILEKLASERENHAPGISFPVTINGVQIIKNFSGGLVSFLPKNMDDFKEAITRADSQLYESKNSGRNCISVEKNSMASL